MRQSFSYEIRNQPNALQSLKQELELTLFAKLKQFFPSCYDPAGHR